MEFGTLQSGSRGTKSFSLTLCKGRRPLSFWHDLPLRLGPSCYTFVCEIPMRTRAKMEVSTEEESTPIRQDTTKDGRLRYYDEKIPWNYGMIPRTWEDPSHRWPLGSQSDKPGDGDPLDVVELGAHRCRTGGVYAVKVVGAFALIDDGEVDWKVLAVRCDSPEAEEICTIDDIERCFPGELVRVYKWFRDYKRKQGIRNEYALQGRPVDARAAEEVIRVTHDAYTKEYATQEKT